MNTTIQLKPGILVSMKTTVSGGVEYSRVNVYEYGVRFADGTWLRGDGGVTEPGKTDGAAAGTMEQATALIEASRAKATVEKLPLVDDAGREVKRWETVKVVADPKEHAAARDARHLASREIAKLCVKTVFGLLCPSAREEALSAAIARSREIVDAHNAKATSTRVGFYVLRGNIASTDEEAARALGEEVRALVAAMDAGINKLDVESIREAASKAASLSEMLSDDQESIVSEAVRAARSAARAIAKRVEKDGEAAAIVLADIKRGAIEKARLAFLDLSDETVVAGEAAPAANVGRVAALDFDGSFDDGPGVANAEEQQGATGFADADLSDIEPTENEDGWWFGMTGPFETREKALRARDSWMKEGA